jgi:uncharacterized protein
MTAGAAHRATRDKPDGSRIASLDFIRGIAVLGILASNIVTFARPNEARRIVALVHDMTWTEWLPWMANYIFIDGKLRSMFAALFGVGMVVFIERARARGASARWLQLRRLFWLALFGYAHYVFLFEGDILLDYAVMGAFALWVLFWNPRYLLGLGILLICLESVMGGISLWKPAAAEQQALTMPASAPARLEYEQYWAAERVKIAAESQVMANGSMGEIIAHRFPDAAAFVEPFLNMQFVALQYLPMMLIGAALYRLGFFSGAWNRRRMLGLGLAGIGVSAAISLAMGLWLMHEHWRFELNYFVFYGPTTALRLPMTLGYLAVLTALAPQLAGTRLGQRLTAAGRMAFSNYLGMSLVMALIFQGWGLGLYDRFNRLEQWGFLAFGCALMLAWSKPWLARFRFGPLEWIWRCLTYWRLFPLRR